MVDRDGYRAAVHEAEADDDRAAQGAVYVRFDRETAVVVLVGEHDLATADAIRDALDAARAAHRRATGVDVSGCTFLDSSALRVLFAAARDLDAVAARLALVMPDATPRAVRDVVALSGLDDAVDVRAAIDEVAGVG